MTNIHIQLSNSTPILITGVNNLFTTASFWGYKSFTSGVPNNNTNPVYVGIASGQLPIVIGTGSYFNWTLHLNQGESLNNFWVKGTSGDGLYLISY